MCFREELEVFTEVLILPLRFCAIFLLSLAAIERVFLFLPLGLFIKLRVDSGLIILPTIV